MSYNQGAVNPAFSPVVDAEFDLDEPAREEPVARREARAGEAPAIEVPPPRVKLEIPRALTAEVRKRIGLPALKVPPYRVGFVSLVLVLAGVPMLLLGWYKATFALAAFALGVLPGLRWYERREIALRDRVYTHGREVVGRVLDVEPGGPDRNGKIVRLEFMVGERKVSASVFGCPLARRGLEPGDDVVVYHDESDPLRCLVVEKIARTVSPKARKVRRPEGGCGGGGCGKGACGGGGCGGGGCGGGGCGAGGCG